MEEVYYPVNISDKVNISGRFDARLYGCQAMKMMCLNMPLSALSANTDYTIFAQMGKYAPRTSLNKTVITNTGKKANLYVSSSDGNVIINFEENITANEKLYICEFFI